MTSPSTGGPIRLGGLTSGFDTEGIIQQLLAIDQAKVDSLKEEQEINVAKVDTWNDIVEQLKLLAETVTKLKADGTGTNTLFDDKVASSSDSTVMTATASSSAINAEYDVAVTTLAKSQVAYGSQKADAWTLPAGGDIIINGETITLATGDTLDDIAGKINVGTYLTNQEVVSTVIDNRLVIQTKNSGASQSIFGTAAGAPPFVNATDDPNNILQTDLGFIDAGGDLTNISQAAADASYSINGIPLTSSDNVVSDAIDNMTLTLVKSGNSTLSVKNDTTQIKETLLEFIDLFNETRDFINRTRSAKLSEEDEFGLFFSDSLLRELYNEVRGLTTGGVKMGGADWDGSVQVSVAGTAGDKSLSVNGFTNGTGTLSAGDTFTISGDSTVYTLQNSATIAGNAATLEISPPLTVAAGLGSTIDVVTRTTEDFGIGVRTDTVSGTEGVLGLLDEGKLDSILATDVNLIKSIFTRNDTEEGSTGIARRLYDWVDSHTKISLIVSTKRSIDDIKIPGIEDTNTRISEQIKRLEERMAIKEQTLIKQFSEMEAAMAQAQSAGAALQGFGGGGGGQ